MFSLEGRRAIVTGSSRGIGRAIAEKMAQAGARVVISSRHQAACDAVADAINGKRLGAAVARAANISSKADLEGLIEYANESLGGVDILVCNAASNPFYGAMLDIPDKAFQKTLSNNILSNHWLIRGVAAQMKERKRGAIIIISSAGGLHGTEVLGAYTISKAADYQLARNYAMELGPYGINVNCISPGLIKTDFARALWENPEILKSTTGVTPLRRLGEAEEIAGAAVFLASPAGGFVSGHNLVVDGGVSSASMLS